MVTVMGTCVRFGKAKTVGVTYLRQRVHRQIGKILTYRVTVHAHDAHNECSLGDKVLIQWQPRPITQTKRWAVVGLAYAARDLQSVDGVGASSRAARFRPLADRHVEELRLQLPLPKDHPRGSEVRRY